MNDKYFDYIICGSGASGILLLKALRQDDFFKDQTILIVDKELKSQSNCNEIQDAWYIIKNNLRG